MKIQIDKLLKTFALLFAVILVGAVVWTMVIVPSFNSQSLSFVTPTSAPVGANGVVSGTAFSGPLTVNLQFLNHGDLDAVYTTANGTGKLYHKDGTLFGTMTSAGVISGNVNPADNGLLYLQWQPASTVYLDAVVTAANNGYLSYASPMMVQGVAYYYFPVNVASLQQISGLTTSLNLNMYLYVADVSGLSYTSLTNATSADYSGTARVVSSCNGYISGMTQETAFKIVKVEMSMPDAANITMFDNSQIKNLQVQLGLGNGQTWTSSTYTHNTGGTYIQFDLGISDPTQEYYGIPVVYASTNSATDISYTVKGECAGFTASTVFVPTLIVTYIGPDGATGTISRPVSFTDT